MERATLGNGIPIAVECAGAILKLRGTPYIRRRTALKARDLFSRLVTNYEVVKEDGNVRSNEESND
jgi:hypothetical protein